MHLTGENFAKARNFILSNARLLERRRFHYLFDDGSKDGVFYAMLAYQNPDGGFGHGLEPDTSSPESQPLFTQMAFDIFDEIDYFAPDVIDRALQYLDSITKDNGGLHGIEHPWMVKAEEFCWAGIAESNEALCSACILRHLVFLEQRMDDPRAEIEIAKIKERILAPGIISYDPNKENIGMHGNPSPLSYAPTPTSILRSVFSDEQIERDLNRLIGQQQEDGRWATPYGISPGTRLEWDGMNTLGVLKILKAYDKIEM